MGGDVWPTHPDRHVRGTPIHSDLHRVMFICVLWQEGLGYPTPPASQPACRRACVDHGPAAWLCDGTLVLPPDQRPRTLATACKSTTGEDGRQGYPPQSNPRFRRGRSYFTCRSRNTKAETLRSVGQSVPPPLARPKREAVGSQGGIMSGPWGSWWWLLVLWRPGGRRRMSGAGH
jgi:hypothetical protein